jgi:hypothetical protein
MQGNPQQVSLGGASIRFLFLLNAIILKQGFIASEKWYWLLSITLPLMIAAVIASYKKAS